MEFREGQEASLSAGGHWIIAPLTNEVFQGWLRFSVKTMILSLDGRLERLEKEGLDHHTEEWQVAFDFRQRLTGILAMASKKKEDVADGA